jgi:ribosomal protein S19E (S16A)
MDKLKLKDLDQLREWVDQMYWDFDRLSSSGQETLDKIAKKIGLEDKEEANNKLYDVIDTMDVDKLKREIIENEKN